MENNLNKVWEAAENPVGLCFLLEGIPQALYF